MLAIIFLHMLESCGVRTKPQTTGRPTYPA